MYHKSVGCNGKLEIDFAISPTGQLAPNHVSAYAAFGAWQRACYGTPLNSTAPGTSLTAILTLPPSSPAVDRVMLREDLTLGQNVNGWTVEADLGNGTWTPFLSGSTVGNKRIAVAATPVLATRLRLTLQPSAFPAPYVQNVSVFAVFAAEQCTLPPPKGCVHPAGKAVRFVYNNGQCLVTNSSVFPCGGGANNACPLFLGSCQDPTALWTESTPGLQNNFWSSKTGQAAQINIDCNSEAPGAVAKLLGMGAGQGNPLCYDDATHQIVYSKSDDDTPLLCLDGGGGPYGPVCGREERSSNQIATQLCSGASTVGWTRQVALDA